ncbi:condensation domain-containing protein, partial [Streptomyces sp. NPDC041068]|uniref:condensation domain-containing protein n=1 Tax=Streptomyces sp. NPDC041068 TaxID=3155130 RepID=UPI0033C2302C
LHCQPADSFDGLPADHFDTILINSVIQYFPDNHYLSRVIDHALDLLTPGGRIIIGDVRNARTLRALHAAVHQHRGTATPTTVDRAVMLEKELVVAPDYFTDLATQDHRINAVDIQLKQGTHHNELTRHRYEAVLHKNTPHTLDVTNASHIPWNPETDLTELLRSVDGPLRISGIPNARLMADIAAERRLDGLEHGHMSSGVDPAAVVALGADLGLRIVTTWSPQAVELFDAVVLPSDTDHGVLSGTYLPQAAAGPRTNSPRTARGIGAVVDAARRRLIEQLPDYMVPSAVVALGRLPRTPNGKLDRGALPMPDHAVGSDSRGPRTAEEQVLCTLFAEVLGIDRIGIGDSFFDLGGHSLLATRLTSRVRSVLGAELQVRDVFETPTVAGLAQRVNQGSRTRAALTAVERPDLIPLSFAQRRLWFLHKLEGRSATYNMPLAFRLTGAVDSQALHSALRDVLGRHESLRTVFPEVEGRPYQRVLDVAEADFGWEHRTIVESHLAPTLEETARYGFDLSTEVPVRAWLFDVSDGESVLLLLLHHIAADGWSMGPLARDVVTAYAARSQAAAPKWTELPVQYADYTLWQRDLLGEESDPESLFRRQVDYWTQQLHGMPELVSFPTDRARPAVASYEGTTVKLTVDGELHRRMVELAQQSGSTVFMVLQAGMAALLTRL